MRKILFIGMLFSMLTLDLHAENEKKNVTEEIERYELNVNYSRLANTLSLTPKQTDDVRDFIKMYNRKVQNVILSDSETEKETLLKNVFDKHVRTMHNILVGKQYREYVHLFNLTMENRGIELK